MSYLGYSSKCYGFFSFLIFGLPVAGQTTFLLFLKMFNSIYIRLTDITNNNCNLLTNRKKNNQQKIFKIQKIFNFSINLLRWTKIVYWNCYWSYFSRSNSRSIRHGLWNLHNASSSIISNKFHRSQRHIWLSNTLHRFSLTLSIFYKRISLNILKCMDDGSMLHLGWYPYGHPLCSN